MGENQRTPNIPWMERVKRFLGKNVTVINEHDIDTEN